MNPLWIFWNALLITCAIIALSFLLATGAALFRFSASKKRRAALDLLFLIPLALPPELACSYAKYGLMLGFPSWLASSCFHPSLALESIALLPILYFCAYMGFRRVSLESIDAARLQGLRCCGIFWRSFFPAAWPWLLAGLALSFFRLPVFIDALLALHFS